MQDPIVRYVRIFLKVFLLFSIEMANLRGFDEKKALDS